MVFAYRETKNAKRSVFLIFNYRAGVWYPLVLAPGLGDAKHAQRDVDGVRSPGPGSTWRTPTPRRSGPRRSGDVVREPPRFRREEGRESGCANRKGYLPCRRRVGASDGVTNLRYGALK